MATETIRPADLYEQFYGPAIFRPLSALVVELAQPREGERVLDLACGTGLVARGVAPRVGAAGRVVAVDLNPAMIEVARGLPPPEGGAIEWVQGDAVALDLPAGSFDLALCQQGLQFFADRAAALARVREALAPGGRVVVAVWRSIEHQPLFAEFARVEAPLLEPLGVGYEELVAPFSLGEAGELRSLLEGAGFAEVEVVERVVQARFPSPETFARKMETAYGAVIPEFVQDPDAFAAFLDAVEAGTRDIVARYTEDGSVSFPMPAHLARAWVR